MNEFKRVLFQFKNSCKSKFVSGDIIENKHQVSSYNGIIPLTEKLLYWYNNFSPSNLYIPWVVENICFFNFEDLIECQFGYRWSSNSMFIDENWNDSWVVIGSISSNPIIVDISDCNTPVFLALHGVGEWKLKQIANNIEELFAFLSCWICNIIDKFNRKFYDSNFQIRKEIVKEINECLDKFIEPEFHSNILEFIN